MEFVIQDISLHYASGESNLDLDVEIFRYFMAWFEVLLEKYIKKAAKNVLF